MHATIQKPIGEIGTVDKQDRKQKAAEMMGRFLRGVKSMAQGMHIMPLGWTDIVPEILKQAEISGNGHKK